MIGGDLAFADAAARGIIRLRALTETKFSVEIEDRVRCIYAEQHISLKRWQADPGT